MRQDNNELDQMTANPLQFKALATGTSTVYEQIIRTYHPTGQMVAEVVHNFYLAYEVYYCDLIKYAFVTFVLHECDKKTMPQSLLHSSQARMLKVELDKLHDSVDKLLDAQCILAADEVRDLLDSSEVPF